MIPVADADAVCAISEVGLPCFLNFGIIIMDC
uniref:Uncharacterized protein n=1 Tax=Parascaris equorum TaxID=6256 RepID=A0A914R9G5_PAREQ